MHFLSTGSQGPRINWEKKTLTSTQGFWLHSEARHLSCEPAGVCEVESLGIAISQHLQGSASSASPLHDSFLVKQALLSKCLEAQACQVSFVRHRKKSTIGSDTWDSTLSRSRHHSLYALACIDEHVSKSSSSVVDVKGVLNPLGVNDWPTFSQRYELQRIDLIGMRIGRIYWFIVFSNIFEHKHFCPRKAFSCCILSQCFINHFGRSSSGFSSQFKSNIVVPVREPDSFSFSMFSFTTGWELGNSSCILSPGAL